MSSLMTKAWGFFKGADNYRRERFLCSEKELRVLAAQHMLLPKALKGKMNVAVILNPTHLGFNIICFKCWSVDVVLNMDLFYISNKRLCHLFSFLKITWMNNAHLVTRANTFWMSKKTKNKRDWVSRSMQHSRPCLSVPFADHVVLLDCLNWHCAALYFENARWQKVLLKRWIFFLPSKDLLVSGYAAQGAVNDPPFDYKESLSPAFWFCFLYLSVLNVPPQCNVALLIPLCVFPLPITISCLL